MACIAVAVSGGVDSLYALVSLHEQGHKQGHEVIAIHGRFLPVQQSILDPVCGLDALCQSLRIPLHVLDMRQDFDHHVIQPFVTSYALGTTPNPCALCNTRIKFGLLLDKAQNLGADFLATGHYATLNTTAQHISDSAVLSSISSSSISLQNSILAKGKDKQKDQSYFLALVPPERLRKALFPLAQTHKHDNRAFLAQRGIVPPLERESQEICFVPADAYRPFLQQQAMQRNIALSGTGPILLHTEQDTIFLGTHRGLWQYTEGQRRGLGIGWKEPLYVCGKDIANNSLLLGTKKSLTLRGCVVRKLNTFIAQDAWPTKTLVRLRYRQEEASAHIVQAHDAQGTFWHITLHKEQNLTAPGQIAAVYANDGTVLGGGIIDSIF